MATEESRCNSPRKYLTAQTLASASGGCGVFFYHFRVTNVLRGSYFARYRTATRKGVPFLLTQETVSTPNNLPDVAGTWLHSLAIVWLTLPLLTAAVIAADARK